MTVINLRNWFVPAFLSLIGLAISFVKHLFGFPIACIRHLPDVPAAIAFEIIRPLKRVYRDSMATDGQSLVHRRVFC